VIDSHFGLTSAFFVYDIGRPPAPPVLIEKRRNFRLLGQGGITHEAAHHHEELERIANLLSDCDAVFVARIGSAPANFLIRRGFRVFQIEAGIEEVIEAIWSENETEEAAKENV
jgi:predicted Fe-Mo cluster-binding NifX family protein